MNSNQFLDIALLYSQISSVFRFVSPDKRETY